MNNQYLKAKNEATPDIIHSSTGTCVGKLIYMTKLVEWPVVDRVPDLLTTLYNGHL